MQLLFTIVNIRITTLTWISHDHPLVEYPLCLKMFQYVLKKTKKKIYYTSSFDRLDTNLKSLAENNNFEIFL